MTPSISRITLLNIAYLITSRDSGRTPLRKTWKTWPAILCSLIILDGSDIQYVISDWIGYHPPSKLRQNVKTQIDRDARRDAIEQFRACQHQSSECPVSLGLARFFFEFTNNKVLIKCNNSATCWIFHLVQTDSCHWPAAIVQFKHFN